MELFTTLLCNRKMPMITDWTLPGCLAGGQLSGSNCWQGQYASHFQCGAGGKLSARQRVCLCKRVAQKKVVSVNVVTLQ